ncbi:sulfotransferase domain-containing protein [Ekhidna sp.]|uniref:sulfotransferase domain-containing protein n=1 Tax=Ekhidna sp. TaxID=2608089 RepID=UPI003C7ABD38
MGISRIWKDLQLKWIASQSKRKPEDAIVIFSDPRGGSTWLAQILSAIPKSAIVWEPLHLDYNQSIERLGFSWRQHIPIDATWNEAKSEFDKILSGKRLNSYLALLNDPSNYQNQSQLIVKFCRGNGLIPWLTSNYQFRYKPIHFIRHPYAIAASQKRHGGWNYEFNGFEYGNSRYDEIYHKHKEFLDTIETKWEATIATWCMTNQIPLSVPENTRTWLTIYYEDLFLEPEIVLKSIFDSWNMKVPQGCYDRVRQESYTTRTKVGLEDKASQLRKWEKEFSKFEIERFDEIMNYFQIDLYRSKISA